MKELIGSEKQVKWANEIRSACVARIQHGVDRILTTRDDSPNIAALANLAQIIQPRLIAEIEKFTKAADWIDYKGCPVSISSIVKGLLAHDFFVHAVSNRYVNDGVLTLNDTDFLVYKLFEYSL